MEYRPGKLNTVADALSRRDEDLPAVRPLSSPIFDLCDALKAEMQGDAQAQALLD